MAPKTGRSDLAVEGVFRGGGKTTSLMPPLWSSTREVIVGDVHQGQGGMEDKTERSKAIVGALLPQNLSLEATMNGTNRDFSLETQTSHPNARQACSNLPPNIRTRVLPHSRKIGIWLRDKLSLLPQGASIFPATAVEVFDAYPGRCQLALVLGDNPVGIIMTLGVLSSMPGSPFHFDSPCYHGGSETRRSTPLR